MLLRFERRTWLKPCWHPIPITDETDLAYSRGRWITFDTSDPKNPYTVHLHSDPSDHPDPNRKEAVLDTRSKKYKLIAFQVGKDIGKLLFRLDGEMVSLFDQLVLTRGEGMTGEKITAAFYARAVIDHFAVVNYTPTNLALFKRNGRFKTGNIVYPSCVHNITKALKMHRCWNDRAPISTTVPIDAVVPVVLTNAYHHLMPSMVEKAVGMGRKPRSSNAVVRSGSAKAPSNAPTVAAKAIMRDDEPPRKRARLGTLDGTEDAPIEVGSDDDDNLMAAGPSTEKKKKRSVFVIQGTAGSTSSKSVKISVKKPNTKSPKVTKAKSHK